jgi:hypothetical protein
MADREREDAVVAFRAWFERNVDDVSEWDERWVDFAHLAGRVLARLPFGNRVLKDRLAEAERIRDINKRALEDCHRTIDRTAQDVSAVADVLGLRMGQETLLDAVKRVSATAQRDVPSYVALVNEAERIVQWGGSLMRVAKCLDPATQCLACDRLGKHLEPVGPPDAARFENAKELAEIRKLLLVTPDSAISTLDAVREKAAECGRWASEVGRLRTAVDDAAFALNRVRDVV